MCWEKAISGEMCERRNCSCARRKQGSLDDSEVVISGEEAGFFMRDTPGDFRDEYIDSGGCTALAWQVDHRAKCLTHQTEC